MLYLPCISNFKFPTKICFVLFSRILIKLWLLLPLIVLRSILGDLFLIFRKKAFKLVQNTRRYSTCVTFEGLNFNWCLCNKRYRVRLKRFTSTKVHIKVTNIIQNSFLKYTATLRFFKYWGDQNQFYETCMLHLRYTI